MPRDQVRLLVARPGRVSHARFVDLGAHLSPGDVLVVNTSATRPAAIDAQHRGARVTVHLSTDRRDGTWSVELRRPDHRGPVLDASAGEALPLRGGGGLHLLTPAAAGPDGRGVRLWIATITVPSRSLEAHMRLHGRPIAYTSGRFLLGDHQTVFATHPGSAEMASAARPFSDRLVTSLVSRGVQILPLTLHAGVSSQETGEPPQPEWIEVPAATADLVTRAHHDRRRVIAVGTTATRALEAAWADCRVRARRGWTDLVITPERGARVVSGLITGWHEVDASHLLLLEAVAGQELVQQAYAQAVAGPYLWHEFGDSALLLP